LDDSIDLIEEKDSPFSKVLSFDVNLEVVAAERAHLSKSKFIFTRYFVFFDN
jgi:hypothetical protein